VCVQVPCVYLLSAASTVIRNSNTEYDTAVDFVSDSGSTLGAYMEYVTSVEFVFDSDSTLGVRIRNRLIGLLSKTWNIFPYLIKIIISYEGENLDDYPDSPGEGRPLSREEASSILDREDPMETGSYQGATLAAKSDEPGYGTGKLTVSASGGHLRRDHGSKSTRDSYFTTSSDLQCPQVPMLLPFIIVCKRKNCRRLLCATLTAAPTQRQIAPLMALTRHK
jgi:hypothetical protein